MSAERIARVLNFPLIERALQVYTHLLDDEDVHPFDASMGLFLGMELHKAYDEWEWSLYCKVGQSRQDQKPEFPNYAVVWILLRPCVLPKR